MKKIYVLMIIPMAVILLISCSSAPKDSANTVWPVDAWIRSTPEEQGVDSEKLLQMLKLMGLQGSGINSMVIIRNGYCIAEFYKNPYTPSTSHLVNSCTKSFTSAVVGIALQEKVIKSLKQPVLSYYNEIIPADPKAQEITIEDLLTMRSGFTWPIIEEGYQYQNNLIPLFFSKPVTDEPGTMFYYNSMNSVILANIIDRATSGNSVNYYKEKIFDPIGIDSWCWLRLPSRTGINSVWGGTGLAMTTEDLARLGYLYLHNGKWDGKQVVPKKWVKESLRFHTGTENYIRSVFPPYYGYYWWILNDKAFTALGGNGQICYVNTEYNIIIAINSNEGRIGDWTKKILLSSETEIPHMATSGALPENRDARRNLEDYLDNAAKPIPAGPFGDINSFKEKIAGKRIIINTKNVMDLSSIIIEFSLPDKLIVNFEYNPEEKERWITGMNGVFIKNMDDVSRYFPEPRFYGNTETEIFARGTSAGSDFLNFELVYTGALKSHIIYEINIDGEDVELRRYLTHYVDQPAHPVTVKGKLVGR